MDDFKALIDKIELLRAEHKQLEQSMPRLSELKRQGEHDLESLNAQLAIVLGQLDDARTELASLKTELEARREKHDAELSVERSAFISARQREQDELQRQFLILQERTKDVNQQADALAAREAALGQSEEALRVRTTDLDTRTKTVETWEQEVATAKQEASDRLVLVKERENAVEAREAAIEPLELSADELVKQAQAKLKEAERQSDIVTNRVLKVEAKEHEIIQRETALTTRGRQLDQREIGLQDKEAVRASRMI